jgi:hypothetical protein
MNDKRFWEAVVDGIDLEIDRLQNLRSEAAAELRSLICAEREAKIQEWNRKALEQIRRSEMPGRRGVRVEMALRDAETPPKVNGRKYKWDATHKRWTV